MCVREERALPFLLGILDLRESKRERRGRAWPFCYHRGKRKDMERRGKTGTGREEEQRRTQG